MSKTKEYTKEEAEKLNKMLNIGLLCSMFSVFFCYFLPSIVIGWVGVFLCSKAVETKRFRQARLGAFAGTAGVILSILCMLFG